MKRPAENSAYTIAEMIVRIGRSTHEYVAGLSPAQWSVLRYLAAANRFSRTVSAFADFHGTTRGTASQTVKSLEAAGYVKKTRSADDGRSSVLELTRVGRTLLPQDPRQALVEAAAKLPTGVRDHTAKSLRRMLGELEKADAVHAFGTCKHCAYLEGTASCDRSSSDLACSLKDEVLDFAEIEQLCVNFESTA